MSRVLHENALGCVLTIPDSFCAAAKIIPERRAFCSKTVVAAQFLLRSKYAPYRSLKWRVTYRIGVHTIPDSFCTATKIIPDTGLLFKNGCGGAVSVMEAPHRSLKWRVTYRIGVHTIPDSFRVVTKSYPDSLSVELGFPVLIVSGILDSDC